jgi:hypothetical protein
MDSSGSEYGPVGDSNKPLDSIKGSFHDKASKYRLLDKNLLNGVNVFFESLFSKNKVISVLSYT